MESNEDTTILETLNDFNQTENIDFIAILTKIESIITNNNASSVLGMLVAIQSREIKIENDQKDEFIDRFNRLKIRLNEILPFELKKLIPKNDIKFLEKKEEKIKKDNILEECKKIITETLIKTSKHEIWNNINVYFNKNDINELLSKENFIKHLFNNLITAIRVSKTPEIAIKILKEIAYLIQESDIDPILSFFNEFSLYFPTFLIILKKCNNSIYEELKRNICSEKRYFKENYVCALPEFEFNKVIPFIKDYNWNVAAILIQKRPEIAKNIIDAFHLGELGISRKFFIESLQKQDYIFSNYISNLNLSTDELVDLCTKSYEFTKKYFNYVETDEQMLQFCKILSKNDEDKILSFLIEVENLPVFENFLKTLLKVTRLGGELKNYIISKYTDNKLFFNSLIPYLDVSTIEPLLSKYYEEGTSIDLLLRKLYPQELIIEIHKFKDTELACNLIKDCISNPKFEDKDWVLALKSLETVYSTIKTSTSLLILKSKKSIKPQTINFLKHSINDTLWKSQNSIYDLIKCLEYLKDECFVVFDSMTRDEIIFVLRNSKIIESNVRSYLKNYQGRLPKNLLFVLDCLDMV